MTGVNVEVEWQLLHSVRERTGIDNDTEAVRAALTQFVAPAGQRNEAGQSKEERLPTEEATSYWG